MKGALCLLIWPLNLLYLNNSTTQKPKLTAWSRGTWHELQIATPPSLLAADLIIFTVVADASIISLNLSLLLNPVSTYQVGRAWNVGEPAQARLVHGVRLCHVHS